MRAEDTCMSYEEEHTCMSYEEEHTCTSYEEEDTCMCASFPRKSSIRRFCCLNPKP